ncbi:DinB family protein [Chitinophaga polysaccharea]|uniref:DinB family protein n=1 Tax=Chitinophaga polysaccharea TaxID=1293035 RepID=UPI0014553F1E|nr:DinB family protein [Chitinophaga polysaccharea]NLR56462.1 DinB family protein [Chitinophaga polysaccharea]
MKKDAISPDPGYYTRYISLVPDTDLNTALDQAFKDLATLDAAQLEPVGNYAYGPGKWTVKEVLQHITDTERVFTFRALMFARGDKQVPPSMDQDEYAAHAATHHRSVAEVLEELKAVRMASIALFKSFSDEVLQQTGMSWKTEMSVLALGFTTVGHQLHHLQILRERYLQTQN